MPGLADGDLSLMVAAGEVGAVETSAPRFDRWRLALAVVSALFAAAPAPSSASKGAISAWETVVVEGRQLPKAYRVSVREIGLFRVGKDGLEPIPFQIDERAADGRFALPGGPKPTRDDSPGILDDNDELVFSTEDLGPRAVGDVDGAEIHVTEPLTDSGGWVYLRLGYGLRHSARDAVRYDPATDTIYARRYVLGFGPHTTKRFAFVHADGTVGRNLLDRVKARITVKLLGGLLTFRRTEEDITSKVIAWKDGPIRVIRRTRIEAHIGYGLPSPVVISENIFTGTAFNAPATVRIPFNIRYVLGSLTIETYMDFANVPDFDVFTINHAPVPIACGRPVPPVDGVRTSWFGMTGPEGTFVQDLRMSKDLSTVVRQLYAKASTAPDPPERVPGDCPGIGYRLTHWGGIGRGAYWSDTVVRAFDEYTAGDVQLFLYSVAHPLRVTVAPPPGS